MVVLWVLGAPGSGVVVVVVVDGVSVFVVVELVVLESVDMLLLGAGLLAGVVATGAVCWQPVITSPVAAQAIARILL